MHYILYLVLEGFFVQTKAPDKTGSIAVTRDNIVLDVNAEARRRGIAPGMEKRTARAVAHETTFYVWEEDTYEEAQNRWLDLCTEFTGIIEPEEQNSAYLDLSAHPNPIDVAEKLVRTLVQETGLRVFYGPSSSKWIARLASKHGDCGSAAIDPAKFLSGLSVFDLTPVSLENRQRFNFLGYRTIGDILTIPEGILRQQFGAEGLFIAKAARGDFGDPVLCIYPRDSLIETLIFDGAVDSTEIIDLALKDLATRIAARLAHKSLQGQEVTLNVEFDNGVTKQLMRRFSKSIYNLTGVLVALRLLFNEILCGQNSSPATLTSQLTRPLAPMVRAVEEEGKPALSEERVEGDRSPHARPVTRQKIPFAATNRSGGGGHALIDSKSTINQLRDSVSPVPPRETSNASISAIRITLTNLKHRREKQTALLGQSKTDSATAVNVVRTVFGDSSVQLGAEIPVPRRVKVLREWKNATGWS